MPKHYTELYYHFVWATWRRYPFMVQSIQESIYKYVNFLCCKNSFGLYAVNGIEDHIHVVMSLKPTICISDAVKNLKGSTAHFCNNHLCHDSVFKWQQGYGAFTIDKRTLPTVVSYVKNQKLHHTNNSLRPFFEI
jgi:putative transposase